MYNTKFTKALTLMLFNWTHTLAPIFHYYSRQRLWEECERTNEIVQWMHLKLIRLTFNSIQFSRCMCVERVQPNRMTFSMNYSWLAKCGIISYAKVQNKQQKHKHRIHSFDSVLLHFSCVYYLPCQVHAENREITFFFLSLFVNSK